MKTASRNIGLDIIRFVAVVWVLGAHMRVPPGPTSLITAWNRGGWVGVDLFFVLSGYLVSSILFREHQKSGAIDIRRFLIRRGLKIYPAFWIMMGTTIGFYWIFKHPIVPRRLLGEVLFLQNYLGGVWPHTWSLAVEEHFYLGLAAIIALFLKRSSSQPFSSIPQIFTVVAIVSLFFRILNCWLEPNISNFRHLFMTHLRLDSLFFGVFIAYLVNYRQLERRLEKVPSWLLIGLGGLCLAPAFIVDLNRWIVTIGLCLFYFGSGLILLGSIRLKSTSRTSVKFIAALGAASYSIYLWHIPVNVWGYLIFLKMEKQPDLTKFLVFYVLVSLAVGFAMNRCFESRFLQWRDYWFPSADKMNRLPASSSDNKALGISKPLTP